MPSKTSKPRAGAPRDPARERLLEVAKELFATQGVDAVTVRHLADAAAVNVAAVNYYFGSKDGLLLVLFRREAKVLVEQRRQKLLEFEGCRGPVTERLELLVRALIEPVLRWCIRPEVRSLYVPTLLRAALKGQSELRAITERESQDLQPFASALSGLLPELPRDEVYWRLHYVLALEHSLISGLPRLDQLSNGLCDTTDIDAIVDRTVRFALRGLAPEAATSPPTARVARAGRRKVETR